MRWVIKFEWIDFGQSWKEPEQVTASVEKLVHTSTASLLAEFLRRRDAPFNKVFCWMRRDEGVLEASSATSTGVRLVEMTFPFAAYEKSGADRLAIFADWLVRAVALGAPELGIDEDEVLSLKQRLTERDYTYIRRDKLSRAAGEARCEVIYEHSPSSLLVTARCKLPNGEVVAHTFRKHPLIRDELVYGRAISRCTVGEDGHITVEPLDGFR